MIDRMFSTMDLCRSHARISCSSNRVMKAKNRQERYKKGYILLEGKRLIADAIQAGADLLTIFVTDRQILDVIIDIYRFIRDDPLF